MIATHQLTLKAGGRTLVDPLGWQAGAGECWCSIGRNGDVMQSTILGRCLGHPIDVVSNGTRRLFIPTEEFA